MTMNPQPAKNPSPKSHLNAPGPWIAIVMVWSFAAAISIALAGWLPADAWKASNPNGIVAVLAILLAAVWSTGKIIKG